MANKRPLRKALRASLVVTAVALFVTYVWDLGSNGFYATLACVVLLVMADFGGPPRSRFLANLLTGLGAMLLIALGVVVIENLPVALVVTAIVAFVLAYAVVLRGYVGAAFAPLLLPYVVTVTTPLTTEDLPQALMAYGFGTVISAVAAVTLWPSYHRSKIRQAAGGALLSAANYLANSQPLNNEATERQSDARMRDLVAANNTLDEVYTGQLNRPGSGTSRDRGLVQLIDDLTRLRISLRWPRDRIKDPSSDDLALLKATQEALDACGKAMLGQGPIPVADALIDTRAQHVTELPNLADKLLAEHRATELGHAVNTSFYYRITAFLTTMIVFHTQYALGDRRLLSPKTLKHYSTATTMNRMESGTNPWRIMQSQFSFRSPWFRRAIQTSVGITLAVAVVPLLHLQHGFWVSLGIVAALKLDATDTRKTALGAISGTVAGFVIIALMLVTVGENTTILAILLPFVVFLAIWLPAGSLELPLKQAGFTVLFVMLSSLANGLSLGLGAIRVEDVSIGLLICLLVTTLMWPRGVATEVRKVITNSIHTTAEYFVASYTYITSAMQPTDRELLKAAAKSATAARIRAAETFDVAISQGGSVGVNASSWSSVANSVDHIFFSSIMVTSMENHKLVPIPFARIADSMRVESQQVADQFASSITKSYEQAQVDSAAARRGTAIDPAALDPHIDAEHELSGLSTEIQSTLQSCNGQTGKLEFAIDGNSFHTSYSKATISILWAQDWLLYFHWMANATERQTAQVQAR